MKTLVLADRAIDNTADERDGWPIPSTNVEIMGVESVCDDVSPLRDEDLAAAFDTNRQRLSQMVRLRMDQRLQGRIDVSDVLQDAFVECLRRLPEYRQKPSMPLFLWIRFLTGQKLVDLQRMHLGTKMRAVGQEVSANGAALAPASSISLVAQLLGKLTSPSQAAVRAEIQLRVQEALDAMEPIDREVLALRHFEMLTNEETAQVLGLKKSAASNRYIRAVRRLKAILVGTAVEDAGLG